MLCLDSERAFDRPRWARIERCMSTVGFGLGLQRWVCILPTGASARVALHGWHTDFFPVDNGVFQGNLLSTLLYMLHASTLRPM